MKVQMKPQMDFQMSLRWGFRWGLRWTFRWASDDLQMVFLSDDPQMDVQMERQMAPQKKLHTNLR